METCCVCCDTPVIPGKPWCSPKCRGYFWGIRRDLRTQHILEVRQAIWYTLSQWGRYSDGTDGLWSRIFYTIKALICIFCGWYAREYSYHIVSGLAMWGEYTLCGEYSGLGWNELVVGHGIWDRWGYYVEHETSV